MVVRRGRRVPGGGGAGPGGLALVASALHDVHVGWAWVVITANAAVGLWALAAHRWEALRLGALWRATALAQGAVFVEVLLGVAMVAGPEQREPPRLHMFYGFLSLFAVALLLSYRSQLARHRHLLYGFGGLLLMGLGLRALQLGGR